MEVLAQFEEAVGEMRGRFMKSRFDPEKIGKLLFEYKDTHGLPVETSLEVIDGEIRKEWWEMVEEALVYSEKLEKEKK